MVAAWKAPRWTRAKGGALLAILLAAGIGCRNEAEQETTRVPEPPTAVTYDVKIATQPASPIPRRETQISVRAIPSSGSHPDFDDMLGSPVHLVAVRRDLSWYEHLHPRRNGDSFTAFVRFPTDGTYVIHSIVNPVNHAQLVSKQYIIVGSSVAHAPIPLKVSGREVRQGHYTIHLRCNPEPPASDDWNSLTFTIARDDMPVTDLTPTGTLGHVVILREGGEDFVYAHSTDGEAMSGVRARAHSPMLPPSLDSHQNHLLDTGPDVTFHTRFPRVGKYKMWVEFREGRDSIKADFVVEVREHSSETTSQRYRRKLNPVVRCEWRDRVA